MNRDHIVGLMRELGDQMPDGVERARPRGDGSRRRPRRCITTTVDVREFVDAKRAAMAAHASQIAEDSFFLQLPPPTFRRAFG